MAEERPPARGYLYQVAEVGRFNAGYHVMQLSELRELMDKCVGMSDTSHILVDVSTTDTAYTRLKYVAGMRIDSFIKDK